MAQNRTTLQLYRDCLRLAKYIGQTHADPTRTAPVTKNLMRTVKQQFRQHQFETNPDKIKEQREVAINGLTQYMFFFARQEAVAEKARRATGAPEPERDIYREAAEEEEEEHRLAEEDARKTGGVGLGL